MKVLAINGSPTGDKGKTWWVLEKFIQGMEEASAEVTTLKLAGKKIHYCTGEYACWFKTPGKCIHKDDMSEFLPLLSSADTLVLATPVYVDGMSGLLKNFIDRILPIANPLFEIRDGHARHIEKITSMSKIALISVCGFPELDNFDPLVHHIKAMCKNMNAEYAGHVLRPGAPGLEGAKYYHPFKTHAVSKAIKQAGVELVKEGRISEATSNAVEAELFTTEEYIKMANKEFQKEIKKAKEGKGEQENVE